MDEQQHKYATSSSPVQIDGTVQGLVVGERNTIVIATPQPDRVRDQNRQRFLVYLRTRYHDVLEQSLQGAALIALGLNTRPEAIAHPAHLVFRHLNQPEQVLPAGTSITEVYDQAGGELLILGDPGAGKSTLLLHLAQGLLARAERDTQQLLPVIFNLSSWAQKRRPLDEWLIEELLVGYQVPRKVGKLWVQNGQILPLLDGLDEVAASDRDSCIDAINIYRRDHLVPLVVCSRTTEYLSQQQRLVLQNAVVVQPLTTEEVDDYLEAAGPSLAAVRTVLQKNQVLRELAASPLMLNVLMLTYRDASTGALPMSGSGEEQQRQVFASYIKRMLGTNETTQRTSSQRMLSQLTWLARQMQQQSLTVFYLEQLQPSWLSRTWMLQAYDSLAVRLPGMLMGVLLSLAVCMLLLSVNFSNFIFCLLLGGLLGGILSRGSLSLQPSEQGRKIGSHFWQSLLRRLGIGAFIGGGIGLSEGLWKPNSGLSSELSSWLSFGLSALLLQILLRTSSLASSSPTIPQSKGSSWQLLIRRTEIYNGILVTLLVELSTGLSFGLTYTLSIRLTYALSFGLSFGLTYALSIGLVGGLLSILLIGRSPEIQPTDRLVWSRRSLRKSLFLKRHIGTSLWVFVLIELSSGLSFGLISGQSFGQSFGVIGLIDGLSFGLIYWLLIGLFQGVSSETVEHQQRATFNQGIRHSLSNGLILGLVSTVIVGLVGFLNSWLNSGLNLIVSYSSVRYGVGPSYEQVGYGVSLNFTLSYDQLSAGLVIGLSIGLLAGLLNGGLAYLRHYTLRFLLWWEGSIPWRFPEFLDEAARHILLRKIGGGYVFIHRLFLDYMASLGKAFPSSGNDIASADTSALSP